MRRPRGIPSGVGRPGGPGRGFACKQAPTGARTARDAMINRLCRHPGNRGAVIRDLGRRGDAWPRRSRLFAALRPGWRRGDGRQATPGARGWWGRCGGEHSRVVSRSASPLGNTDQCTHSRWYPRFSETRRVVQAGSGSTAQAVQRRIGEPGIPTPKGLGRPFWITTGAHGVAAPLCRMTARRSPRLVRTQKRLERERVH